MTELPVGRFGVGAAIVLIGASLAFRFLWLDRLPGINGDEAWYGVQAVRFITGKTWSGQTPSGLPINPLLFSTEVLLLNFSPPSFWVLRLPIALWACVGLALTYVLHRWYCGDCGESLLVVALTACMPAHLAYSRFCWDSSFAFVCFPLVLYPLLMILKGVRSAGVFSLLILGILLALWVHVTHAILLAAGGLVLAWETRSRLGAWVRKRPVSSLAIVLGCVVIFMRLTRKSHQTRTLLDSAASSLDRLQVHLQALADLFAGNRIYDYLAGLPSPESAWWIFPLFYGVSLVILTCLGRWGEHADRSLALLAVLCFGFILAAGRAFRLDELSYERYFLYLFPLSAVILVRAVRAVQLLGSASVGKRLAALPLVLALFLLVQFWFCYFVVLRQQTFVARLHPTFQTGTQEPKAELVAALRQRLQGLADTVMYAENWWVQHAVDYLLGCRYEVRVGTMPTDASDRAFVVGFAGSNYLREVRRTLKPRGELRTETRFGNQGGRPILLLMEIGPRREVGDTMGFP